MTKEELVNEAEEHVKQSYCEMCVMADDCKCGCIDCFTVQAYLASAEPREKRIAELEAQIEKMKCCGNCKKLKGRFDRKTNINILYCSDFDMKQIEVGFQMCCCKWEIKEK